MALTKFSPIRYFFRTSQNIPSITHARAMAKEFNKLGDLVEYKFIRVSRFTFSNNRSHYNFAKPDYL